MTEAPKFPPDYYCPNPNKECPGNGADLLEVREPIKDDDGTVLGSLVTMACRVCGYRWGNES
jgi:hypothetical protein